jgi:hypothetical protein
MKDQGHRSPRLPHKHPMRDKNSRQVVFDITRNAESGRYLAHFKSPTNNGAVITTGDTPAEAICNMVAFPSVPENQFNKILAEQVVEL